MPNYHLSHLDQLEAEAIFVLRETAAQFQNPALLFSGGKDSIVMAWLARKAFWPARMPFPLVHIDTGHNFPETLVYRDEFVEQHPRQPGRRLGPGIHRCRPRRRGKRPQRLPQQTANGHPARHHRATTNSTPASAAAAATRKRPAPKNGSSPTATTSASGTRKTSAPNSGTSSTAANIPASTSASSRSPTSPKWTSGCTSNAKTSRCPRIYFSHQREVFERNGTLLAVTEFLKPQDHETASQRIVRFRTIGDATCTGAVESAASTLDEIIAEVAAARQTERGTRADDKRSETAMEDRKKEGYF